MAQTTELATEPAGPNRWPSLLRGFDSFPACVCVCVFGGVSPDRQPDSDFVVPVAAAAVAVASRALTGVRVAPFRPPCIEQNATPWVGTIGFRIAQARVLSSCVSPSERQLWLCAGVYRIERVAESGDVTVCHVDRHCEP